MINRLIVFSALPVLAFLSGACETSPKFFPDMELYPTWSAIGLEITFPDGWNFEKTASFEWRQKGEEWRPGVEFTIFEDENRALASIWPLEQNTRVQVKLIHPDIRKDRVSETVTRKMILETSGGKILHVSPSGNKNALGTADDPFGSIARATENAGAGDRILLHSGVYREGGLFTGLKGLSGKPLIITAAEGEQPVVDGSVTIPKGEQGWDNAGDGLWSLSMVSENDYIGYVAQDGLRMFWYKSLENIRRGEILLRNNNIPSKVGRGWFYEKESKTLYIRTGDASIPGTHNYNVAVHAFGALLSGNEHMVVQGIEFRFFGESGICLDKGTQACIIRNNLIHNAQQGIIFHDSLTRDNAIWHNEIYEPGLVDYTWSQIKASEYGRQAIDGVAGRGNSFCHNLIHGYFDAIAPAVWGNPGQFHLNRDMDIMYNRMYNIGDDAIEVEGGALNVRIHGNMMRNCFVAISLAPIEHGPTYATRNDATYSFLMFKLNVGVASEGYSYCYHNSGYCLTKGEEYGGTAISFASAGMIPIDHKYFANNAIICDHFALRIANDRYSIDYNCYSGVRTEVPIVFEWELEREGRWEQSAYTSMEEFSSATHRELNGIVADPMFLSTIGAGAVERVHYEMAQFGDYPQLTSPNTGDLRLKKVSPCINRGLLIPGINDKTPDGRPDMGAFEFGE